MTVTDLPDYAVAYPVFFPSGEQMGRVDGMVWEGEGPGFDWRSKKVWPWSFVLFVKLERDQYYAFEWDYVF